jgi:DNA-binding GntR family transcriptional regulator
MKAHTERGSLALVPPEGAYSSRSGSRGEFVYRALIQAIQRGVLRPGDRIREEEVAQSLGVSRTPVREALQLLQTRRLIEMAPGRGVVLMDLTNQQVLELYAMREVLEGAAARFAAQHASATEIALLQQLLDEFTRNAGNPEQLAKLNHMLHRAIYEAARNAYMQEALANLEDGLSLLQNTTYSIPERHASADREHRAIVAAIERRDMDGAEALSRLHIRESQRIRLSMLMNVSGNHHANR